MRQLRHVSDKSIKSREESIGKNNFDFDLFDGATRSERNSKKSGTNLNLFYLPVTIRVE